MPVLRDHGVLGLEIAVDDASRVRRSQGPRDLAGDAERLADGKGALAAPGRAGVEQRAQRPPAHQLHGDEDVARVLADVVDGGDARIGDGRRRALRKRFQLVKEKLYEIGRREGLVPGGEQER